MSKKKKDKKKPYYGKGVDPHDPNTWVDNAYVTIDGKLFDQNNWTAGKSAKDLKIYKVVGYKHGPTGGLSTFFYNMFPMFWRATLTIIDGTGKQKEIGFDDPQLTDPDPLFNYGGKSDHSLISPNITSPNTSSDSNTSTPNTTDSSITKNVIILRPSDVDRGIGKFNPPPHRASRSVTPMLFPGQSEAFAEKFQEFNTRGIIFMDSDTAQHDNGTSYTRKDLWGFQFMYNPTTISYTNSANTNIDYTNNQDVALLLTGSQQFTISLLLNRVTDMGVVQPIARKYKKNQIMIVDTGENYNRKLDANEVQQLAARGTDFDLEFLYRVLNGDPLSSPQSDFDTSDFGYISGMPVWIRLNNQMRYKGTIGAVTVNHVMFTRAMVPIMTEVSISFLRIPTMGYQSSNAHIKGRFTDGTGDSKVSRIPQYTPKASDTTGG